MIMENGQIDISKSRFEPLNNYYPTFVIDCTNLTRPQINKHLLGSVFGDS